MAPTTPRRRDIPNFSAPGEALHFATSASGPRPDRGWVHAGAHHTRAGGGAYQSKKAVERYTGDPDVLKHKPGLMRQETNPLVKLATHGHWRVMRDEDLENFQAANDPLYTSHAGKGLLAGKCAQGQKYFGYKLDEVAPLFDPRQQDQNGSFWVPGLNLSHMAGTVPPRRKVLGHYSVKRNAEESGKAWNAPPPDVIVPGITTSGETDQCLWFNPSSKKVVLGANSRCTMAQILQNHELAPTMGGSLDPKIGGAMFEGAAGKPSVKDRVTAAMLRTRSVEPTKVGKRIVLDNLQFLDSKPWSPSPAHVMPTRLMDEQWSDHMDQFKPIIPKVNPSSIRNMDSYRPPFGIGADVRPLSVRARSRPPEEVGRASRSATPSRRFGGLALEPTPRSRSRSASVGGARGRSPTPGRGAGGAGGASGRACSPGGGGGDGAFTAAWWTARTATPTRSPRSRRSAGDGSAGNSIRRS